MHGQLLDRQRAQITDACERAADPAEVFEQVSMRLRRVLPFDGSVWFGADPATMIASSPARIENVEDGHCDTYWDREHQVQDANLYRDLSRRQAPAATLTHATDGHLARSARYRDFLKPQGYADELRVVLRVGSSTWGMLALFREAARPAFSAQETAFMAELSKPLAAILRSHLLRRTDDVTVEPLGPGVVMFDSTGRLLSANDESRAWFSEMPLQPVGNAPFPVPVVTVAAKARSVAEGLEPGPARLRLQGSSGRWLVLHASTMRSAPMGDITVVVIEPAQASEIAPIIVQAYDLSPREQEITQLIARGLSTTQMAETLLLSTHTVRDYVKAVFEKVGVTSRGELVARLFAEHYGPRLHTGAVAHVQI